MILEPDFLDHWKTRLLVDLLGGDEAAPLYVLRVWTHCENRKQTQLKPMSNPGLKALCRYPGEAEKLASALIEAGFIERDGDDGFTVPKFRERNSKLFAAWQNGQKGGRPKKTQPKPNANPTVTEPEPNSDIVRLDKSREGKKKKDPLNPPRGKSRALAATTGYSQSFENFWAAFPGHRRTDKPKAWLAYQSALVVVTAAHDNSRDAAESFLTARAADYALSAQGRSQFVRGVVRWLNQQAWLDPPEAWARGDDAKPNGQTTRIEDLLKGAR